MCQKTVLMLIASPFQSRVWRAALTSQNISVIGGTSNTLVQKILADLKTAQIPLPNLLLIDFDLENPYDLCRWCRLHYPDLKIVLISSNQRNISVTERRWAIHQGADDLLSGFQKQYLLSSVIARVSKVLEILNCSPLQEIALVPAMLDFCKEAVTPSEATARSELEPIESNYLGQQTLTIAEKNSLIADENKKSKFNLAKTNFTTFPSIQFWWLILPILFLFFIGLSKLSTESKLNRVSTAESIQKTKDADTFQDVAEVPKGMFNYDGSTTWVPILKSVNPQIQQDYPQLKLRYSKPIGDKPGSSTGIKKLLQGQIDFAISSRPLTPEEYVRARQQGFSLSQHEIGIDGIAVVVNHSLPVDGISIESLKQIYLGKLTNWNQLGGPNLEIVPFSRKPEDSGTATFFRDTVLNEENFGSEVKYPNSTTQALRQVNSIPNGIYYASASEIVSQCTVKPLSIGATQDSLVAPYEGKMISPAQCPQLRNQIDRQAFSKGSYPLTRNLFVIVKRNGARQETIGKAYTNLLLSKQGQKLVEEAGFIAIE